MLKALTEASNRAQTELAAAEILLLEATAAAGALRAEAGRLEAAVAALSGESPPATNRVTHGNVLDVLVPEDAPHTDIHTLSPEEFDAERKRKQRVAEKAREAEEAANNPLYHMKCSGCGRSGKIVQTMMQAPSGASLPMRVCTGCNNQMMG